VRVLPKVQSIKNCESCDLCKLEKNDERLVPHGFISSNFMMIGMSPTHTAEKLTYFFENYDKHPYNKTYSLLDKLFANLNIDFDTMWKTNVQKCMDNSNDFNEEYFKTCYKENLTEEIKTVNPKVVFLLGAKVADLFDVKDIGKLVYNDEFKCMMIKIYHPSYSLRGGISADDYENHLENLKDDMKKIISKTSYVNLHHHNQFSFRDAVGTERDIATRLNELKIPGFSLTNHGNMNAYLRQYNACQKYGIKPIFGNEMYYTPFLDELKPLIHSKKDEDIQKRKALAKSTFHITMLAKNFKGFKNLVTLTNKSWKDNFYKFPRINHDLIDEHKEGLIVLSGCPGGYIPVQLIKGNKEEAYSTAKRFKKVFGDDFYVELMFTKYSKQQKLNDKLIEMAKDLDIKTVLTVDSHYINPEDYIVQQIIWTNNGLRLDYKDLNDPAMSKNVKTTFDTDDLFIKDIKYLNDVDLPRLKNDYMTNDIFSESINNINEIFCKIESYELDSKLKIPTMYENSETKFKELILQGIENRKIETTGEFKDRLKEEMSIITDLGFIDYFLCIYDIIDWTKRNYGVNSVGVGRGSAAGSIVNYLLGITDLNPLDYEMLIFERFLSPGRKDLVDIDTDFAPTVRPKVFDYVIDKFGRNNVSQIGNYQTIKLKMALQDVLRTMNIPHADVLKVTKSIGIIPEDLEVMPVEDIRHLFKPLDSLLNKYPKIGPMVDRLKGQIRSVGQHAAGVLISNVNLSENIPLVKTSSKTVVTANTEGGDFHELTSLGYVKYDFLSLNTLDQIIYALALVKKNHSIDIDWDTHEIDSDKEIYKILQKGDTYGIFQYSSELATGYLKKMQPTDFDDLAISSALLRPGPLDTKMHIEYADRKNGLKDWKIEDKLMPILGPTLGIIIYQEQILRISQELADFTKEEANVFRKALVKYERSVEHEKKRRAKVNEFADKLIKGMSRYMTEESAKEWWKKIEAFARYGFNAAHAYSYAVSSYRQMYLKYYFPKEFYVAGFNTEVISEYKRIANSIMRHPARRIDYKTMRVEEEYFINLLRPCLKIMNRNYIVHEDSIIPGIAKLKWMTKDSYDLLQDNLTDEHLSNFDSLISATYTTKNKAGKEVNKKVLSKKVFEALAYSGALDYFDIERNDMIKTFNKKNNAKVEEIGDKLDKIKKETNIVGFSTDEFEFFQSARKEVLSMTKFKGNILELSKREWGKCADLIKLTKVKSKKTKNGKPYRLCEVSILSNDFYPIFVWNNNMELKVGEYYIALLSKQNGFTNMFKAKEFNFD